MRVHLEAPEGYPEVDETPETVRLLFLALEAAGQLRLDKIQDPLVAHDALFALVNLLFSGDPFTATWCVANGYPPDSDGLRQALYAISARFALYYVSGYQIYWVEGASN